MSSRVSSFEFQGSMILGSDHSRSRLARVHIACLLIAHVSDQTLRPSTLLSVLLRHCLHSQQLDLANCFIDSIVSIDYKVSIVYCHY